MPKAGYEQYLETDPGRVIAHCYDLVCNGSELAIIPPAEWIHDG